MNISIPNFSKAHILVIGDIMLDRYWHGSIQRISPEAPVPIMQVQQMEERPGGAANVALNIAALGGQVTLLGFCGQDNNADLIEDKLLAAGIKCHLLRLPQKSTITKLRILSLHQQLIRLDFEENFFNCDHQVLLKALNELLDDASIMILSDYGKGTLKESLEIIRLAKQKNLPILVDPKGKDFTIYKNATILTPNRKEFEEVMGTCQNEKEIIEKGQSLIQKLNLKNLLITLGAEGMTLLSPTKPEFHLSAITQEVYDVTGAGDTVIAMLALGLATGCDIEFATLLANRAAGIVVGKLGATSITLSEIRRAIHDDQFNNMSVLNEDELMIMVQDAKAHKERIVMTNGCFDILHAGHIAYLKEAKSLGDRLIVAVNDDASVARLKGTDRPINTLQNRMQVLAALNTVDWVVPFSEDTPERLITKVLPDILVKGGDYKPEQIAGHKAVYANGGLVKILQFVEGCSTSKVIEKLKNLGAVENSLS